MATRKQRKRRDKTFRHEYETVLVDAEGNETPVERVAREKAEKRASAAKGDKRPAKGKSRSKRPLREVQPPSWQRALRRGGIMGAVIFVLFVFVIHGGSQSGRALTAVFYAVMFIPLTYWTDRWAYRTYLRRAGLTPPAPDAKPKR